MNKDKHTETPLPWNWDGKVWDYNKEDEAPWLTDNEGNPVLSGEIECNSETNAKFIVRACNNHYSLLEALKEAVKMLSVLEVDEDIKLFKEAIKQAEA